MSTITSVGLSGMKAAEVRLSAAASNIANAQTEGYRPVDAVQIDVGSSAGPGGVSSSVVRRAESPDEPVDLASELIAVMVAKYQFEANAKVVEIGNKVMKTTIDMIA